MADRRTGSPAAAAAAPSPSFASSSSSSSSTPSPSQSPMPTRRHPGIQRLGSSGSMNVNHDGHVLSGGHRPHLPGPSIDRRASKTVKGPPPILLPSGEAPTPEGSEAGSPRPSGAGEDDFGLHKKGSLYRQPTAATLGRAAADPTQTAFEGYETIDFEEPDHPVLRLHFAGQGIIAKIGQEVSKYAVAFVLTILIAVIYNAVSLETEKVGEWRLEKMKERIEEHENLSAFGFGLGISLAFTLVPSALIVLFSPSSIGSGMTEVIAFLNGASTLTGMTWLGLSLQLLGIIGLVSGGLYSGIDGPMAKIGAGLGILLVQGARRWTGFRRVFYGETLNLDAPIDPKLAEEKGEQSTKFKMTAKNLGGSLLTFLEQKRLRLFATLGAAVAISAIFRAPIGGVMFAVEETTSFFEASLLIRTTFCTMIAYIITAYFQYDIREHFTTPVLAPIRAALFPVDANCDVNLSLGDFLSFLILAIVAAFLGHLMNLSLSGVQRIRQRLLIDPFRFRRDEAIEEAKKAKPGAKLEPPKPVSKFINVPLRLAEVALVCIITTAIVVWVPESEGIDVCTPFNKPLTHVTSTAAECGFFAAGNMTVVTCEQLGACQQYLTENVVCYPNKVFREVNLRVPNQYDRLCSNQTAEHEVDVVELTGLTYNPEESDADIELVSSKEEKCYFEIKSLFWSTPERQLKLLLLRGLYNIWSYRTLLIFGAFYIFLCTLTYYIALPTDNVVPNLIIGAIFGRLYGLLLNHIRNTADVDPGAFAMIGMAAFWSGTSRLVVTVIVVVLELTGDMAYLPALIIVCFAAAWISGGLGESLYHAEMENNGAPYLPSDPAHVLKTIETSKVMTRKLYILRRYETIRGIKKLLASCPFEGFPIVETYDYDEDGPHGEILAVKKFKPIGYVRRARLVEVVHEWSVVHNSPDTHVIELESIATSNPSIVREDATASKVFRMFRQLGLKHVFVCDRNGFLVGLVTRRDLLRPSVIEEEEKKRRKREEGGIGVTGLGQIARQIVEELEGKMSEDEEEEGEGEGEGAAEGRAGEEADKKGGKPGEPVKSVSEQR
ncbi:chloride channel [Zopfochytrium polystomum]|nr:chloride channel [Zopfochytrium polystomum]